MADESQPQAVFLVHGIQSNGAWHDEVAKELEPYFQCRFVKYREYHSLGAISIFFWLWALPLAGIIGWKSLQFDVPDWSRWGFLGAVASAGLLIATFAGLARSIPFMLMTGFYASALEDGERATAWFAGYPGAAFLLILVGEIWRKRRRRGVLSKMMEPERRLAVQTELAFLSPRQWLIPTCVLSVLAVLLAFGAYGAGLAFRLLVPGWLLVTALIVALCFVLWRESDWVSLFPEFRAAPVLSRVKHLYWLVVLIGTLVAAGFLLDQPLRDWLLWGGIVLLMVYLELKETADGVKESVDGVNGRCPLSVAWRRWIFAIAVFASAAWILLDWEAWTGFVSAAVLLFLGWTEPVWRIERTAEHVNREIRRQHGVLDARPSIIAHSLGTFVYGETVEEYDVGSRISYDRVLLVGAAISERFDWQPYLDADGIQHVRNEFGGRDVVISLLRLSGGWANRHGLGGAGYFGLIPPISLFHRVPNHRISCAECRNVLPARIHNYFLDRFRHSTATLRRDHAFDFWLPYLWGHSPEDWRSFILGCKTMYRAWMERRQRPAEYRDEIRNLQQAHWDWDKDGYARLPLTDYIEDAIRAQIAVVDQKFGGLTVSASRLIQDAAAVLLAQCVAKGLLAHQAGSRSVDELKLLIPLEAIRQAARMAYAEVVRRLETGERPGAEGFDEPCQSVMK